MAENKKSFILYADLLHTIELMPDENAGKLFKHILKYVNDLNPETEDLVTQLTFEPIKQQLKRDLLKWEDKSVNRSESGRLGGIKSGEARRSKMKQNEANASNVKQNEHVTVNVNVNDSVNVNESLVHINIEYLKFNDWCKENAPNVLKLKEPISEEQYFKLKEHDRFLLKDTLIAMHNFKDLRKKYVSAYLTLNNWIKRNNKQENGKSRISTNIEIAKQYIEQSRNNGL
jgi:hypothetical protein